MGTLFAHKTRTIALREYDQIPFTTQGLGGIKGDRFIIARTALKVGFGSRQNVNMRGLLGDAAIASGFEAIEALALKRGDRQGHIVARTDQDLIFHRVGQRHQR